MIHTRAKISQKSSGSKDKVENKLTDTTNFITFNQLPTELKLYRSTALFKRKLEPFIVWPKTTTC